MISQTAVRLAAQVDVVISDDTDLLVLLFYRGVDLPIYLTSDKKGLFKSSKNVKYREDNKMTGKFDMSTRFVHTCIFRFQHKRRVFMGWAKQWL